MSLWTCGFAGGRGGVQDWILAAGGGLGLMGGTGGGFGLAALYCEGNTMTF